MQARIFFAATLLIALAPAVAAQTPALQTTFTTTPSASQPGTTGILNLALTNLGAIDLHRIQVTPLRVDQPVHVDPARLDVGGAAAGQTINVPLVYAVPEATATGIYRVSLQTDFCQTGGGGGCGGFVASGLIHVATAGALAIDAVQPTHLDLGSDGRLLITVRNDADAQLSSVEVQWTTPDDNVLPVGSGNSMRIEALAARQTHVFSFDVATAADAAPGVHAMTVTATGLDATGRSVARQTTVGLRLGGLAVFNVSMEGHGDELTVHVGNIGTNPASAVVLRARTAADTSASTAFVGDLDPGDFAIIGINSRPWGDIARDDVPVELSVEYTDGAGQRQSHTTRGTIQSNPATADQDAGNGPGLLTGLGVAAAAVTLVALAIRRRRGRRALDEDAAE